MKNKTIFRLAGLTVTLSLISAAFCVLLARAESQTYGWIILGLTSGPEDVKASLFIDSDDKLYVSYREHTSISGDLKYLYNIFITDTEATYTVDTVDLNCGSFSSLIIDSNGNPHISYTVSDFSAIKYAKKIEGNWAIETVDTGWFRLPVPLALDSENNLHISYVTQETSLYVVKYAKKTGDTWNIETVGEPVDAMRPGLSIALDSDNMPHIAFGDADPDSAWYATKVGNEWVIEKIGGIDPSLALDSDDNPHISYYAMDGGNPVVRYSRKIAGGWVNETIDSSTWNLRSSSLALDTSENPNISYSNGTHLRYAAKIGENWTIHTVDSMGGDFTCLKLDSNNYAHILYYGHIAFTAYLKYAVIPEFPSFLVLSLSVITVSLVTVLYRIRHTSSPRLQQK